MHNTFIMKHACLILNKWAVWLFAKLPKFNKRPRALERYNGFCFLFLNIQSLFKQFQLYSLPVLPFPGLNQGFCWTYLLAYAQKPFFSAVQSKTVITFLGNYFKTVPKINIQILLMIFLIRSSIVFWPYLVILAHNWTDLTICAPFTYIWLMIKLHLKQPDKKTFVL